ncbi:MULTISPECIES: hypothetical protein [Streptomyces]|uniref:Uncharacterized protein n=1 Tax=Streptomyces olivaceoviridis TaxID=1921 RepID=A0ABW7VMX3_STROI|nr:hypothetical protein [Streptomyces corchorusii]
MTVAEASARRRRNVAKRLLDLPFIVSLSFAAGFRGRAERTVVRK